MAVMASPIADYEVFRSATPVEQTLSKPLFSRVQTLSRPQYSRGLVPTWKVIAFSVIDKLIEEGRNVAGLGDFRPTEEAAGKLRIELDAINVETFPSPTISPISGGGLMARWRIDSRSIEITIYHDGEIVKDAMENDVTNEDISELDPGLMLQWLSGGLVFVNATPR